MQAYNVVCVLQQQKILPVKHIKPLLLPPPPPPSHALAVTAAADGDSVIAVAPIERRGYVLYRYFVI